MRRRFAAGAAGCGGGQAEEAVAGPGARATHASSNCLHAWFGPYMSVAVESGPQSS